MDGLPVCVPIIQSWTFPPSLSHLFLSCFPPSHPSLALILPSPTSLSLNLSMLSHTLLLLSSSVLCSVSIRTQVNRNRSRLLMPDIPLNVIMGDLCRPQQLFCARTTPITVNSMIFQILTYILLKYIYRSDLHISGALNLRDSIISERINIYTPQF